MGMGIDQSRDYRITPGIDDFSPICCQSLDVRVRADGHDPIVPHGNSLSNSDIIGIIRISRNYLAINYDGICIGCLSREGLTCK